MIFLINGWAVMKYGFLIIAHHLILSIIVQTLFIAQDLCA